MKRSTNIEDLLKDGFTIKMANFYYELMQKEWEYGLWSSDYIEWSHSNGFLAESASAYNLNENNINDYLSDYDYYKIWPLNSWERIWINDKLTLKYMLEGTEMEKYMPYYYYYIDKECGLISLCNNYKKENTVEDFKDLLKEIGIFACKPCNGSGSLGFFKLSFENNKYYINDSEVFEDEIDKFINTHTNYIVTEYILPCDKLSVISPIIHTIRLLVINDDFHNPKICGGYMRFANKVTGIVNHIVYNDTDMFDYDVELDLLSGYMKNGKKVFLNRIEKCPNHPDSKVHVDGKIDCWDEIVSFVKEFSKKYCLCQYLGFDLCVSNKGIKVMEINSHSGIKHIQLSKPLLKDSFTKEYFIKKIRMIDNMDSEQLLQRHNLWR